MAQSVAFDPWNWQRRLSKSSITKAVESHPDCDRINHLIENKRQMNDTDALVTAIQCLFDLCDSAALNNYIRLRSRIVHYLNVTSAALFAGFLLGRMADISSTILGIITIAAVTFIGAAFWVHCRTNHLVEQIESTYVQRKTEMLVHSLEQLGYQARIVQE